MPAQLTSMFGRVQKQVQELSLAQRVFAVLLGAGLVLAAIALTQWINKPQMSPLFTNLSPTDAAAIVDELNSSGVPYELTAGGSTIMVPNSQLYDTRLRVASEGLLANSDAGYSLLDGMSMTSSEFQQQVTYQRALEGELARTIGAMDGVSAASVKLAIPQESVFVSETPDPTASVFIQTGSTGALPPASVQAIVHLVSASIESMKPEGVAVIDSNGVVLSSVGGDNSTVMQSGQISEYEKRIATSVQAMLDRVVGSGNAVVSVSAELDYDKTHTTTETYSSDPSAAPISESMTREEYSNSSLEATTGGVLGADNLIQPRDEASDTGNYLKETAVRNNAVNKVTSVQETAPGSVKRQSVSVVVSKEAAASLNMGELEQMVAAAAGVDEDRGDVVSVSRMTFDQTMAETAQVALTEAVASERAAATKAMYIDIAKWVVLGLVVILVFFLILRMSRNAGATDRMSLSLEAIEELEQRTQSALEQRAQAVLDKAAAAAAGELALEAPPVPDMEDVAAEVRNEIMTFAAQQPAEVAEVLRGWINSGRQR
jgi:flagellar M-ring protein FliF